MSLERWLEVRLRSQTIPPEDLVEGLLDLGGRAVWEEGGWQVTHLQDPGGPEEVRTLVQGIYGHFAGREVQEVEVETRWQAQRDWEEYWRRGLDARRLTDRLVVTPSWIEPETEAGDLVITLDPGMAFGNAEHGTTRGCLRVLDRCVEPGTRLLDVGAGSAILAIAAALLGAAEVDAVEADPLAVPTARENVEANGVADRVKVREERITSRDLAALTPFDGVMANLETGFLVPLLPGLVAATRSGGWLLMSGILQEEWAPLRREVEEMGLEHDLLDVDGDWCSGLFRRPASATP